MIMIISVADCSSQKPQWKTILRHLLDFKKSSNLDWRKSLKNKKLFFSVGSVDTQSIVTHKVTDKVAPKKLNGTVFNTIVYSE